MLWLRRIVIGLAIFVALLLTLWSAAALYFDSPFPELRAPAAVIYLIVMLAALVVLRRSHLGVVVAFAGFAFGGDVVVHAQALAKS